MLTPTQWMRKYDGKYIEWDGSSPDSNSYNQCVDAIKCYVEECFGIVTKGKGTSAWGNAVDYYTSFNNTGWGGYKKFHDAGFVKIPNTIDLIPMLGDVIVWKVPSKTGHIGVVYSATQHTIKSYDQNYGSDKRVRLVNHNDNYKGVCGVLRPPHIVISDVNVRTGPGSVYKKVDELLTGFKVTVYATNGNWVCISKAGDRWISKNYINKF